jgi:hypothetical protein
MLVHPTTSVPAEKTPDWSKQSTENLVKEKKINGLSGKKTWTDLSSQDRGGYLNV